MESEDSGPEAASDKAAANFQDYRGALLRLLSDASDTGIKPKDSRQTTRLNNGYQMMTETSTRAIAVRVSGLRELYGENEPDPKLTLVTGFSARRTRFEDSNQRL